MEETFICDKKSNSSVCERELKPKSTGKERIDERSAKRTRAHVCKKMWACVSVCVSFCRVCYQQKPAEEMRTKKNEREEEEKRNEESRRRRRRTRTRTRTREDERMRGRRERIYFCETTSLL